MKTMIKGKAVKNDNMNCITQKIMEKRQELGLSLRELSRRCSVSYSNISRIEHGIIKYPRLQTLIKIFTILDIPYEVLFYRVHQDRIEKEKKD